MSEQHFTRPNVPKVVGALGTTPEQRGLSTQEFKDKFDEMPEGIQQYIKETLLTELDAFKQEFIQEQEALATHQAEYATYKTKLSAQDRLWTGDAGAESLTLSGSMDDYNYLVIITADTANTGTKRGMAFYMPFSSVVYVPTMFGTANAYIRVGGSGNTLNIVALSTNLRVKDIYGVSKSKG